MHLLYVDESGDPGLLNSPTRFYILSGLVVHELRWLATLDHLIAFRRRMRRAFGLKLREEIHAAKLITGPGVLARIPKHDRLTILRAHADAICSAPGVSLLNVVVDKYGKVPDYDVFRSAWRILLHRLHDTAANGNLRGPRNADDRIAVYPDPTDVAKLDRLVRELRRYNPVPHKPPHGPGARNLPLISLVEDPSYRDSAGSYFIQAVDTTAYLLFQRLSPNAYMRNKGGQNYFGRLSPVLCRAMTSKDPDGIVRL